MKDINQRSTWSILSEIDVSDYIEKKGNLSYISWAYAWSKLMEKFPDSSYWFGSVTSYGETAEVTVTVKVKENQHTMWLPVMDNRNNSIKNPTSRDISDSKMRCLVKAIAMHGLAHHLYMGEDINPAVANAVTTHEQEKEINDLLIKTNSDVSIFLDTFKISNVGELKATQYGKVMGMLNYKLHTPKPKTK